MKRVILAAALLAASTLPIAVAASLAESAAAAAPTQDVQISNFAFAPSSLDVTAGATVQWTNHDTAPHDVTVTSGPVAIHSPMLSTGQSWSYVFTVAGTYDYICSIHPDMHAALIVHAAAPAPSTPTVTAATSSRAAEALPNATPLGLSTQPKRDTAHPAARRAPATVQPTAVTTTTAAVAAAAGPSTNRELKPLLLVAGLVAAIATFCLLLLASERDNPPQN